MRYLGFAVDPTAGGSSLDDVAGLVGPPAGDIPLPTEFVPVTTAQANPGTRDLSREDDVRNRRASSQPISFAATPNITFESRAWTKLLRWLLPRGMGGTPVNTGVAPAAIQSVVSMLQSGNLPPLVAALVREGQVDQMTGLWVDSLEFNFPVDGEGTVSGDLMGLYHEVDETGDVAGLPNPSGMPAYTEAYMLRDVTAYLGAGAGVAIDCLSGFGFTVNNNLSDDFATRFCAGKNILEVVLDGSLHRLWYPDRNKLRAQTITGRLDFGDVRPDRELRRILNHAEQLIVELVADPLGTTPAADEMVRLVFAKQTPTGGGADPLQQDGDQRSSYEFTAYLDDGTGKDLEATFVGNDAIAYATLD